MPYENDTPASVPMPADSELFRDAMAPEPAAPPIEQAPQAPSSPPPEGERPRDELGRFLPKEGDETPQAPQPQPEASQAPPAAAEELGQPPAFRWKELREERDAALAKQREYELMLYEARQREAAWQRRLQEHQKPPEEPQIPDVIADPQAYHQFMEQRINEKLRNQEANYSFRLAHIQERELFEQAYGEMLGRANRGDPSIVQAVMRSPDPGVAMMNWYRDEKSRAQLNGKDPETWFQETLAERLKNQQFAGSVMEYTRGLTAQQQQQASSKGNGGPVQLPPSLSRMPSSPPGDQGGDMSDSSLFDHAFREGRSRR